ncbi:hypothetical protein [Cytobacillus dafuensis]|uniref:Uncharacterized protein n=1 Tax=Cytobacillus dafuensis TaxID=1742359 RepID=A0A5B8Z5I9_CYTDA|nr:hypothetical protein [Cytobacillus dafuensis]QED46636.1 hypothetical protein FSZ17_04735 [Cytobacillus dafuensis]
MNDEKQFSYPDKKIIEREITAIVKKGRIERESFPRLLLSMYRQIGVRFLIRDRKEILTAVTMAVILMFAVLTSGQERYESSSSFYGIIMLVSPILYGVLSLLPFLHSKMNGTFEVEMTCKYNLYQLAFFRMLIFSVFCFLLNTVWVLAMAMKFSTVHFVQAFMISTTSLLIFSLLFLYVFTVLKKMITKVAAVMSWIGLNALFVFIDSVVYQQLLVSVPWYLYGIVICLSAYLFLKKIKEFIIQNQREGAISYVNS